MDRRPSLGTDDAWPFKVILCGKKGVGKSTLLRIIREPSSDYSERSTELFKSVKSHRNSTASLSKVTMKVIYEGKTIKAEVWDTGNLEAYGGTSTVTRSYFRDAHAAILVYVPGNQESKVILQEWIKNILHYSPDCMLSLWCNNRSCEFGYSNQTHDTISTLEHKYGIMPSNHVTYTEGDVLAVHTSLRKLIIDLYSQTSKDHFTVLQYTESLRLGSGATSVSTGGSDGRSTRTDNCQLLGCK